MRSTVFHWLYCTINNLIYVVISSFILIFIAFFHPNLSAYVTNEMVKQKISQGLLIQILPSEQTANDSISGSYEVQSSPPDNMQLLTIDNTVTLTKSSEPVALTPGR